jgi:hypothetical protein
MQRIEFPKAISGEEKITLLGLKPNARLLGKGEIAVLLQYLPVEPVIMTPVPMFL